MPYTIIRGFTKGSHLLYVPGEKYLYVRKNKKRNQYVCYQEMLLKSKSSPENSVQKCTGSVVLKDGKCFARKSHVPHGNHKAKFDDYQSRNDIIDSCVQLRKLTEGLSIRVPAKQVFTRKISKLAGL